MQLSILDEEALCWNMQLSTQFMLPMVAVLVELNRTAAPHAAPRLPAGPIDGPARCCLRAGSPRAPMA